METIIKVCGNPNCEAIYHNCPAKETKCKDCGGRLIKINEKTYKSKYSNNFFQYDFTTGQYYRPLQERIEKSRKIAKTKFNNLNKTKKNDRS